MNEIPGIDSSHLIAWVCSSIKNNENILSSGYQGKVFLYQGIDTDHTFVIKTPPCLGWFKWPFLWMLKHEFQAYQALYDVSGVAKCHGFLNGQYLVLEFIEGETLRQAQLVNREQYYADLLELIQALHLRGIGHTDLKRKDNILVSPNGKPFIIDFGAAIIKKVGFAPINHYLFSVARRFDLNAWVKHKYTRAYDLVSQEDQQYLSRTGLESISRKIKQSYKSIKRLFVKG